MAGREFGPPPSRIQEFEISWRNWLYLLYKKIYKRTYQIELQAFNSVVAPSNSMADGVIGIAPIVLADDTTNESRHLAFNLPINWVSGTDLIIKIRLANASAQTGIKTVITKLTYNAIALEEVISSAGTILTDTLSLESGVAANTYHVSGSFTIPAQSLGDTVFLELQRDATNDTCVGDVAYQSLLIEYQGFINHE